MTAVPKAVIITRVPIELKEQLDRYAYTHDMSTNAAMQLAILRLLDMASPVYATPASNATQARSAARKQQRALARQRREQLSRIVNDE